MAEIAVRGTDVGLESRILCPRSADGIGHVQVCRARQPVEVQPRVELVRAAHPFGPQRDLVREPGVDRHEGVAVFERRLRVIVHVLGRAGRDQAQHLIVGIVRIGDDRAVVVANDAPPVGVAGLEIAVLNELDVRTTGVLHHADVIHQHLARVEQPENELIVDGRSARARRGQTAVGDRLPLRVAGLVAGGPCLADGVVGLRVAQFKAGTTGVGKCGPAAVFKVMHFVGGVAARIEQQDSIVRIREAARVAADNVDSRILGLHPGHVFGHDKVLAGFDGRAWWEVEIDPIGQGPPRQIDGRCAAVEKLDPLFVRFLKWVPVG